MPNNPPARHRFALLAPASMQKRLWQGVVAMAILIVTIAVTNAFLPPEKRATADMMGMDFLPFYTAGTFVRNGMSDLLYDLGAVKAFQREQAAANAMDLGQSFGPFWNPPFYAWTFVPFSRLPYREALLIWTLLNMVSLLLAMILLVRMLPRDFDWKTTALVPLTVLVSMPFIQAAGHAQNTFTSLLLVAMTVAAWRQRKPIAAGIACGLLLYKPQLAAVIAIVMTVDMGWRVMLGLGSVGSTLALATAVSMPGALGEYLMRLPQNLHVMQIESTYLWERHVTLRAFFRLLLQGRGPGEIEPIVNVLTLSCCALIGGGLVLTRMRARRARAAATVDNPWTGDTAARRRDRLIATTIAASPLLMPFYFDYDLLLLAVPATLLAGELCVRPVGASMHRLDRWLVGAFVAMFFWLMINPVLAGRIGFNGTVVLLLCVTWLMIARATRREDFEEIVREEAIAVTLQHRAAA